MKISSATAVVLTLVVTAVSSPLQTQAPDLGGKLLLKEGTEVKLKFAQELSSKTSAEGDPVNFVLEEDIHASDPCGYHPYFPATAKRTDPPPKPAQETPC